MFVDDSSPLSAVRSAVVRRRRAGASWVPAAALPAPSLIFLALFPYWPVAKVVAESFAVGRFAEPQIGLGNYQRLFADPHFARAAWNKHRLRRGDDPAEPLPRA